MKWRRDRDNNKARVNEAEEVIAEAQRLLSGRAANAGHRRRAWALVSPLAHADREELQKLATAPTSSHPARPTWDDVLAYLAGQVLAAAPGGPALAQVQRQVLVPLELKLLDDGTREPSRPSELVTLVLAALDAYPIYRDR